MQELFCANVFNCILFFWGQYGKIKIYFTKDISSQGLIKVFEALNRELNGKVAVKISTGEPGGHNFLNPKLIAPLVNKLDGTIVENCTAYRGKRFMSQSIGRR